MSDVIFPRPVQFSIVVPCYKVFTRELLQSLDLKEKRFGIEPEMVSKIAHEIGCNAHKAPAPLQFLIYFFIGAAAALINAITFVALLSAMSVSVSATIAFIVAAAVNYWLCIKILFRHKARWTAKGELTIYAASVTGLCFLDVLMTVGMVGLGMSALASKLLATLIGFVLNFTARKYLVFPEKQSEKKQL